MISFDVNVVGRSFGIMAPPLSVPSSDCFNSTMGWYFREEALPRKHFTLLIFIPMLFKVVLVTYLINARPEGNTYWASFYP